jgi:hypothetical protein
MTGELLADLEQWARLTGKLTAQGGTAPCSPVSRSSLASTAAQIFPDPREDGRDAGTSPLFGDGVMPTSRDGRSPGELGKDGDIEDWAIDLGPPNRSGSNTRTMGD